MASALETEKPDIILTGLQSDDLGYGQTGVVLAEVMGYPHATLVMSIETTANGIRVKRELEDGWFQNVEMPLPALLTIQSGAAKLRYATLMGIKKAKSKEIKRIAARVRRSTVIAETGTHLSSAEIEAITDLRRRPRRKLPPNWSTNSVLKRGSL